MKKILFVINLSPPVHGASSIGDYIKKSSALKKEFNSKFINIGLSSKVNEINHLNPFKIFRYIKILIDVLICMIFFRPNLIVVTPTSYGNGLYKDSLIILLIKLFSRNIMLHFHNKRIESSLNKLEEIIYKIIFKDLKVILLSKLLLNDFIKYFDNTKISYLPNGIPEIRCKKEYDKTHLVNILFLSNLIKKKGVWDLLKALKILKLNKLNFDCTVIGDSGDIDKATFKKAINREGLNSDVHYLGPKYGNNKSIFFQKADIFVLPTEFECFPLVILEAMQYGLPIVSTFEGAIPEIVEENSSGFLVKKNDSLELASKLTKLINNKKLRISFGKRSRFIYDNKYRLKTFESNLISIIKLNIN